MLCLSAIQLASGCKDKIYEDREGCPCLLRIGFVDSNNIDSYQIWIFDDDGNLLKRDNFYPNPGEPGKPYYETSVPRCIFNIRVWGNVGGNTLFVSDGTNSLLKQNRESPFDRLYFGGASGNSLKEDIVTMDIEMSKQYSAVELNISCKAENKIDLDQISVRTITNSIGYYLNGLPIEGIGAIQTPPLSSPYVTKENCKPRVNCKTQEICKAGEYYKVKGGYKANDDYEAGDGGTVSFEYNMARPVSLSGLEIELKEGGKDIITIDLGQMLKARSYDINKKNLDDIKIDIDLSTGKCLISCKDWEEIEDVDIVI